MEVLRRNWYHIFVSFPLDFVSEQWRLETGEACRLNDPIQNGRSR